MNSIGASKKTAIFLGVLALALLAGSFSANWYKVTIRYDVGSQWSQRIGIGHGETWGGDTPYYYWSLSDLAGRGTSRLMDVTGACITFAILLVIGFVGSCLMSRKWTSIPLLSASAAVSILGLSWFALQVPNAINIDDPLPYIEIPGSLAGFTGSFMAWGLPGKVLYGPDAGWFLVVLASIVQVTALLFFVLGGRIDGFLQKRRERPLSDSEITGGI